MIRIICPWLEFSTQKNLNLSTGKETNPGNIIAGTTPLVCSTYRSKKTIILSNGGKKKFKGYWFCAATAQLVRTGGGSKVDGFRVCVCKRPPMNDDLNPPDSIFL